VPAVIEETLRFDAPVQIVFRNATQDVEIGGTRIPKGAYVAPLLGSANRDERRFPDPDRFDPARDAQGHVGFGFGKHFCLGASLARMEARVALEALVPELPRLERERPRLLVDSFLVRGPRRLELRRAA
jgi:cytochrome P450